MSAKPNPPPAVRIVCGLLRRVTHQPQGISSEATDALREAAADVCCASPNDMASLGVFPVFNTSLVVIGHACSRTPQHFAVPSQLSRESLRATTHRIATGGFGWGPSFDEDSGVEVTQLLPAILERLAADTRWTALGVSDALATDAVRLDAVPTAVGGVENARHHLLTDDGRAGDLVWGMVHWKAGDVYEGGRVRTWTRDVDGGEQARLVGVAFAAVTSEQSVVELKREWASSWNGDDCQTAQRETTDVMYTEKPFSWWLVS